MGYRNYIGRMSKEAYLDNKDLTVKELCEKFEDKGDIDEYDGEKFYYFSGRDLPTYEELYELGKWCDFEIEDFKETFFTKWEDGDCEFSVATKELLLAIIEHYRKRVEIGYKEQLEKTPEELKVDINRKIREWGGDKWEMCPFNLDLENETIVRSWLYEYAVFDLVRIYKTFDWENDVLIYSGW